MQSFSSSLPPALPPAGKLMSITLSAPPLPSTHGHQPGRLSAPQKPISLALPDGNLPFTNCGKAARRAATIGVSHFWARQIKDVKRNCCGHGGDARHRCGKTPPEGKRKRESDHYVGKEKKHVQLWKSQSRWMNAKHLNLLLGGIQTHFACRTLRLGGCKVSLTSSEKTR